MKIVQFEIFPFALKTSHPNLKTRKGFIVRITDDAGVVGLGEASPLPGFSRETLSVVKAQLLSLKQQIRKRKLSEILKKERLAPSVRCAVEMAVWDILEGKKDEGWLKSIPINALLSGEKNEACREILELLKKGFKTFKLKVGKGGLQEEIEKTKAVLRAIGRQTCLRLDGNRQFDFNTAVRFAQNFSREALEYIEEPFADFKRIPEFYRKTGIGVALDETLCQIEPGDLRKFEGVRAIILKPTILGGFEKCRQFAAAAQKLKINAVVSSSFETEIGLTALARFAAQINPRTAHGLDTAKYLEKLDWRSLKPL